MNRIFGKKKPEVPPVDVSDVGSKVDARVTDLDTKVFFILILYVIRIKRDADNSLAVAD